MYQAAGKRPVFFGRLKVEEEILKQKENLSLPATSLKTVPGIKEFCSQFFDSFLRHDVMTLAAALAFYTSFSMAPILVITLAVVGILGEHSQQLLLDQISGLVGEQASIAVTAIIQSTNSQPHKSGVAGGIGILILLFSASGVFAQFEQSLNVIWDVESSASESGLWIWVRKRLFSMGMVFSLGFLALVSLFVSTMLSFIFSNDGSLWALLNTVVSIMIFSGLFALIFKYLPDTEVRWKEALSGGVMTAVLFAIGKSLIGLYLGKSSVGSAYGAAGSLAVLLAWIYYSSIIVFAGAELTRTIKARELPTKPDKTSNIPSNKV